MLTKAFRKQANLGEIRAAAICFDVRIIPPRQSQPTDAIQVALEHQSGEAVNVVLPYRRKPDDSLHYGELFAGRRSPEFFVTEAK